MGSERDGSAAPGCRTDALSTDNNCNLVYRGSEAVALAVTLCSQLLFGLESVFARIWKYLFLFCLSLKGVALITSNVLGLRIQARWGNGKGSNQNIEHRAMRHI